MTSTSGKMTKAFLKLASLWSGTQARVLPAENKLFLITKYQHCRKVMVGV